MNEKEFIKKMTELMDTEEELAMDSKLEDIEEWDSLSYVAYLAMCATVSDKKILPADVKKAETIHDLYVLLTGTN